MPAWQKELNRFEPLRSPSLADALALQQSYSWGSQQGQQTEQSVDNQVLVPKTGVVTLILDYFAQAPVKVKAITVTIPDYSNLSGFGVFIDYSSKAWSNAFSPPNAVVAPNILSPGSILEGAGYVGGTAVSVTLNHISIAGDPTGGSITIITANPIVQQRLQIVGYVGVGAGSAIEIGAAIGYGMVNS